MDQASQMIFSAIGAIVLYGGGGAAVAYLFFRYLGSKWIENKFAQSLEAHKHEQAKELQQLRIKIESLLSASLKFQEQEFILLPKAWKLLEVAHGTIGATISALQQYPDLQNMRDAALDEFLEQCEFPRHRKDEIRSASPAQRMTVYVEVVTWQKLAKSRVALSELTQFVNQEGIFFEQSLRQQFAEIISKLHAALVAKEISHQHKTNSLDDDCGQRFKDAGVLRKTIEESIERRFQTLRTP